MKLLLLLSILTCWVFATAERCSLRTDNCGPIGLNSNSDFTQSLSVYSEAKFKGEHKSINISGLYGCTNDVPDFKIKSLLSTGSTQVTLHYGKDCAGHVLKQYQGGSDDIDDTADCPGSIFVKQHRYGSC